MNLAMLAMVHICTEVRQDNEIVRSKQRYFTGNFQLLVEIVVIYASVVECMK